jgi:hypothetical protein
MAGAHGGTDPTGFVLVEPLGLALASDHRQLVDRIVSTAWRLRRVIALETLLFDTERGESSAYSGALAYKSDRDKLQLLSRHELTNPRAQPVPGDRGMPRLLLARPRPWHWPHRCAL